MERRGSVGAGILVLGAAGSSQIGAATATTLLGSVGPAGVALLRFGFAAIVLVILCRSGVRHAGLKVLGLTAVFGVALVGMNLSFYEALARTPLGIVVAVEFVGPLSIAVIGSRRPQDVVWAMLAGVGMLMLCRPWSGGANLIGIAFALLAGGFWAGYILLSARVGRKLPGAAGLALGMVVAACLILIPGAHAIGSHINPHLLVTGFVVAVTSSVIPYWLEMEALRILPVRVFGVLVSLEPAIAALVGFLLLGQVLRGLDGIAVGLIIVASIGALGLTERLPPTEA